MVITNADMTIYNKVYDRDSGSNEYHKTFLKGVNWQSTTQIVPSDNGVISANVAEIYIPFMVDTDKVYKAPRNFINDNDKEDCFTISPGDIVIKGIIEDEITSQNDEKRIKNTFDDVRVIAGADTNDNGSVEMQHWKVMAE